MNEEITNAEISCSWALKILRDSSLDSLKLRLVLPIKVELALGFIDFGGVLMLKDLSLLPI
jgi:hypothetical protein